MYEDLRWFASRKENHERKLLQVWSVINCVDGLTTPDNESIMSELQKQVDALQADKADWTSDAISDFNNILSLDNDRIITPDKEALIRIYADAVVISEGYSRTVYYMQDDQLLRDALTIDLEIHLESGGLMANYKFIPF
jgi:hypothetical protein